MKSLIIIVVIVLIGIGGYVATQSDPAQDPGTHPNTLKNSDTYVPKEEEVVKPSPFSVLPPGGNRIEIYDGISFGSKATAVDLSGRGLTGSLKAEVRMLTDIEVLDLSDNNFTGLPAEVGQLKKLTLLNLSNNQFTGIPHELGNLQNLTTLDLRGNDISEFDLKTITERLPESTEILTD